jgi:hypothetical protein
MRKIGVLLLLLLLCSLACTRSSLKTKTDTRQTQTETIQQEEKTTIVTEEEKTIEYTAPGDTFYTTLRFSNGTFEESSQSKNGLQVNGTIDRKSDGNIEVKIRAIAPVVSITETTKQKTTAYKDVVYTRNNTIENEHTEQHKESQTTGPQILLKCWWILLILLLLLFLLWRFRSMLKRFIT